MTTRRTKAILILIVLTFYVCPLLTSAMMQAATINVPAGGDLQAAINAAQPGDTIVLQANADYVCPDGGCILPVKNGSSFINITSSRAGEILGRATPAHSQLFARVRSFRSADPTFKTVPRAHHYKLVGLEITPAASGQAFNIVRLGSEGAEQDTLEEVPHNFILERLWIHGGSTQEVQRGVALNSAETTIRDSWISGIHGRGYDTQAVCGWNGPGPFFLINNYFEASGENVMFGGAPPSIPNLVPTEIMILGNYFFKPLSWKKGDPSFVALPPLPGSTLDHWSVKNLLEFKNARNVVVDGNTLENSWVDAQDGWAVLFTAAGEAGLTPWAIVDNVTFSNNVVKNAKHGIQTRGLDRTNGVVISQQSRDLRITNNLFIGLEHWFALIQSYHNVMLEHNTTDQGHNIFVFTGDPSPGFVYRNNATVRNPNGFGFKADGGGEGTAALNQYCPTWTVEGNVIAGADPNLYPVNNYFPADLSTLATFAGTDGLVPGYNAASSAPSPTPSPVVSPSPSPSATVEPLPTVTPTPTPLPSPTPEVLVVAWPSSRQNRKAIWEQVVKDGWKCVPHEGVLYCRR